MTGTRPENLPGAGWTPATRRESPYQRLKQAIMSGELAPGVPLVETPLAEWCQVSRTPIREALTRLEQDGLVERTHRGLVVRANSPDEIIDLYDTRIVLESKAAAVAAERHTASDLSAMRRAEERYRRVEPDDVEALVEGNRDFHRAIWMATHNRSLVDLLERLDMHLGRYPITTLTYRGRRATALLEHHELVEAIGGRRATRAATIAAEHFTTARDIRLALWAEE
jgi:DNA-binding GntR family transcriptional regulator